MVARQILQPDHPAAVATVVVVAAAVAVTAVYRQWSE